MPERIRHPRMFTLSRGKYALQILIILNSSILPPQYSGRRTFRGLLEPSQTAQVQTKVWISQPGTYSLSGWSLESEVEDLDIESKDGWQARDRYRQGPPQGGTLSCITVIGV
jgi:hypothetical protein